MAILIFLGRNLVEKPSGACATRASQGCAPKRVVASSCGMCRHIQPPPAMKFHNLLPYFDIYNSIKEYLRLVYKMVMFSTGTVSVNSKRSMSSNIEG